MSDCQDRSALCAQAGRIPDELHCSLQAKGFESAHPHALKSATEDSGMRASGLYPLLHRVGAPLRRAARAITDASSSPINSDSSTCRSMVSAVQQPGTATLIAAPAR